MAKSKTLDFTGVKDNAGMFRPRRRPEGDYYARITAVADHTSKDDNEGWVFTIQIHGDGRASYPYYCNFDPKQLWKARNLAIAAGIKVPAAKVKMDPQKLVNRDIGVALEDDEYEGRVKSTIAAVFPVAELTDPLNSPGGKSSTKAKSRQAEDDDDEDEDDEEEETPKPKAKSKVKRAPEPDEDDEDDEDDDEPPAPKSKGKAKRKPEPEDDDDDDDDEDDEPPAKKSKAKGKAAAKGKGKKRKDEDDDDDELDLDEL